MFQRLHLPRITSQPIISMHLHCLHIYTAIKNVQVSYISFPNISIETIYLQGSCCVNLNITCTISYVSSHTILSTWILGKRRRPVSIKPQISLSSSALITVVLKYSYKAGTILSSMRLFKQLSLDFSSVAMQPIIPVSFFF